jgi:DNA-binding HxlR family transcriptional regulator
MENQTIEPRRYTDACDGCTGPAPLDVLRFQRGIRAITGKWKIEIVCSLVEGPRRFGDLRRCLPGITQHMLTAQLRDLIDDGLVIRTPFAEIPPRVDYALSQAGIDLIPTFSALRDWSCRYEHQLKPR